MREREREGERERERGLSRGRRRRTRTTKKPALFSFPLSLYFSRLDLVQLRQPLQDHPLARLRHFSPGNKLVQDQVHAVEVEHEVELADVAKIVVEDFDEEVHGLEQRELVVGGVAGEGEVEARVSAVDDLEGLVLLVEGLSFVFLSFFWGGEEDVVSFFFVSVVVVLLSFSSYLSSHFDHVGELRVAPRGEPVHVVLEGALGGVVERDVVLGEAGLFFFELMSFFF